MDCARRLFRSRFHVELYILQRGVQWKQGVVVYIILYTMLLYNTTPIHCTPFPLHPPLPSIQELSETSLGYAKLSELLQDSPRQKTTTNQQQ